MASLVPGSLAAPAPAGAAPSAPAAAALEASVLDAKQLSPQEGMAFKVLGAISVSHLLNDMVQSLILALYPLIKSEFSLSFGQIGLISLTYQLTASLLQPLIGLYTDKHPKPYSLPVGMTFTLTGLVLLSASSTFGMVLVASALVGTGSSVFHPESSRVARMASGGRHGFAQSFFQVGGNLGSALGPLLAAAFVMPYGQRHLAWFSPVPLLAIVILLQVSKWYAAQHRNARGTSLGASLEVSLSPRQISTALGLLFLLAFSKYFYAASISNYFTFYLIDRFGLGVQAAQVHLFVFLFATAAGTLIGGPLGDRIGRKYVIWASILGVAPLTLLLPHVGLFWTSVLIVPIGLVMASAFSAMLVYAQELIPGRVGLVSGLFFGLAFGMAGLGAAALGTLADHTSVQFVYQVCAFLPLLGVVGLFLPETRPRARG
jgi:FSR family fosmidomycin resistance protein-like MFS transporter